MIVDNRHIYISNCPQKTLSPLDDAPLDTLTKVISGATEHDNHLYLSEKTVWQ